MYMEISGDILLFLPSNRNIPSSSSITHSLESLYAFIDSAVNVLPKSSEGNS